MFVPKITITKRLIGKSSNIGLVRRLDKTRQHAKYFSNKLEEKTKQNATMQTMWLVKYENEVEWSQCW